MATEEFEGNALRQITKIQLIAIFRSIEDSFLTIMITVGHITRHLEQTAPLALQESYDNAGLITGSFDREVTGILICLDSTEAVIDEAVKNNCNLVIAHHPIVFSGLKKINGKNYVERTIIAAIKNDISIYAIHTNLDNVYAGVNRIIAEKLGLKDLTILQPKQGTLKKLVTFSPSDHAEKVRSALFDAGAGGIGNYDECSFNIAGEGTFRGNSHTNPFIGEPGIRQTEQEVRIETIFESYRQKAVLKALRSAHPYEEIAYDIYPLENKYQRIGSGMIGQLPENQDEMSFLKHIKSVMKAGSVRHTALTGRPVKTVAVCGGSGSFLLQEAINAGAQLFLTADFKYHQFFDADSRILIADIGHFESEQYTMELIKSLILEKFSTFAVRITGVNTNPVFYL